MSSGMASYWVLLLISIVGAVSGKVFFEEDFTAKDALDNWVQSEHAKDLGSLIITSGKYDPSKGERKGLQTSQDAKFYAISSKVDDFTNKDRNLVVQFSVAFEQKIDCGGGYVKVFSDAVDLKDMHGESPYNLMFGPDICGPGTKKVHVIISRNGKNHDLKDTIPCKDDQLTHVYTLIIKPDNTFNVLIDNESVKSGDIESSWDLLPPKTIKDPDAKKPDDWDDREKIDSDEEKPEDWDQPEHIPDADATKPADWDDDMDGEWETPMIDNPDFKGEWKPSQIDNPAYKGEWKHPMIDNPDYSPDDTLYEFESIGALGIDVWQVKSGTVFSNILITDDEDLAKQRAEKVIEHAAEEKKLVEAEEEEERKRLEEASKEEKDGEDEDEEEADKEEEEQHQHEEL